MVSSNGICRFPQHQIGGNVNGLKVIPPKFVGFSWQFEGSRQQSFKNKWDGIPLLPIKIVENEVPKAHICLHQPKGRRKKMLWGRKRNGIGEIV
jgi:hypothetical protein